ncbi:MAG: rhodanese-like domain-containing protein [Bacilli bacterium]
MKRVCLLLIICLLAGCKQGQIFVYQDDEIANFDKILINIGNGHTKAYDLRSEDECVLGRIPGFFCMRTTNSLGEEKSLETIFEHLTLLVADDYNYLIILMDNDGSDSTYLAGLLFDAGYQNVHYFASGYDKYAQLKGDEFIPETGECTTC